MSHDAPLDSWSDALHARARAFVLAFVAGRGSPEPFEALGLELSRFQAARIPGLARLARARGVDLASAATLEAVPAVPTDAFRHMHIATFPRAAARAIFRTSGTTSSGRGAHAMRELGTYDAGAIAFGRYALFAGLRAPPAALVLAPPPEQAPESSLGHMMKRFVAELCAPADGARTHFIEGDRLAFHALEGRAQELAALGAPVVVLGTSFAYVHLLDALGGRVLPLPAGSRLMQTGGFKGRSREVPADELRALLARAFAIPEASVICEYGMTELTSQFYERTLLEPGAEHGVYLEPPWARVVPVDAETLAPCAPGEIGLARIEDLLNVDSAFAVQTQDRVVRVPGGFRLLGRAPGAPPRGCSIAMDDLLSGASEPT